MAITVTIQYDNEGESQLQISHIEGPNAAVGFALDALTDQNGSSHRVKRVVIEPDEPSYAEQAQSTARGE